MKGELDNSTITAGDFNIVFTVQNWTRQKIANETEDFNHPIKQF